MAAGQYSASLGSFNGLTSSGAWNEVTNTPYDADDPAYRDPNFSNSSGGAGYVAGRITGLAAGNGCPLRGRRQRRRLPQAPRRDKKPGGGDDDRWTPISTPSCRSRPATCSTTPPTTPSGTRRARRTPAVPPTPVPACTGSARDHRQLHRDQPSRRHRAREPRHQPAQGRRRLVYAAPPRPLVALPLGAARARPWEQRPDAEPGRRRDITTPYKNMVNDVAIQPGSGAVLGHAAWRSGDAAYNGFYLSTDGAHGSFTRINPRARSTRRTSATPSSPTRRTAQTLRRDREPLSRSTAARANTVLTGVYVTNNGTVEGPWNRSPTPASSATAARP